MQYQARARASLDSGFLLWCRNRALPLPPRGPRCCPRAPPHIVPRSLNSKPPRSYGPVPPGWGTVRGGAGPRGWTEGLRHGGEVEPPLPSPQHCHQKPPPAVRLPPPTGSGPLWNIPMATASLLYPFLLSASSSLTRITARAPNSFPDAQGDAPPHASPPHLHVGVKGILPKKRKSDPTAAWLKFFKGSHHHHHYYQ